MKGKAQHLKHAWKKEIRENVVLEKLRNPEAV